VATTFANMNPPAARAIIGRGRALAVDVIARHGDRVRCECCGNTSRRFLPSGSPPRPNVRCPHCQALDRHRILWRRLREIIHPGDRVLHFAPESALAHNIAGLPGIDYTAADLDPSGSHLQRRFPIVHADITCQPWRDGWFDVIVVSHVLEHVPDDLAAMRELRRVLKPTGRVISHHPFDPARGQTFEDSTVTTPGERLRVYGQADHVRIYGCDLPGRWRSVGFAVDTLGDPAALEATPLVSTP
jgi:SAM-dependent methyltransferase